MTGPGSAPAAQTETTADRRGLALTVLLIPAALTLLSVTSVNVALPSIRDGLDAGPAGQSLVLTAYAVAFALVLLPAGRWGDAHGHRRVFLTGTAVFTAASLWCGLTPDVGQLVAARALAGIGGGLVITPVTAMMQLLYQGAERARPFGIMGAVFGASSAAGPLLGGLLVEAGGDLGWRLVFLVNVPIGLLALWAGMKVLPSPVPRGSRGADPVGSVLSSLALIGVLVPFSLVGRPWAAVLGILAVGLLLTVGFAVWERRRERAGAPTVVPPSLFRQRALPVGVVTTFLGFAGFTSSFLMLALLWQDALGRSPLEAGVLILPFALGSMASASQTQRLTARFGVRIVTAGLCMTGAGLTAVGVLVLTVPPESLTLLMMAGPLLLAGSGVGIFVGPNTNASFVQTPGPQAGVASALVTVAQRAGTAVGIGILSLLFTTLPGGPTGMGTQAAAAFTSAGLTLAAVTVMVLSRRAALDRELV